MTNISVLTENDTLPCKFDIEVTYCFSLDGCVRYDHAY